MAYKNVQFSTKQHEELRAFADKLSQEQGFKVGIANAVMKAVKQYGQKKS